jgi:hypothetical protein
VRTLGVVIPCYRQERFLARTLAALRDLPAGWRVDGVVVMAAPPAHAEDSPRAGPGWQVLPAPRPAARAPGGRRDERPHAPLTPGAARMAGLAACQGDWVLFVDADVETDAQWLAAALDRAAADQVPRLAGLWGRIEEWFVDGAVTRPGSADLYRIGRSERVVGYLATLALYRRTALLDAGGYDARLQSEEDFELGLRLRARGWELRTLAQVAGRHWSEPRPSLREVTRRWRTGLCFGQGQVLRLYLGRPGFGLLLRRQSLYLATLALWALGAAALIVALRGATAAPLVAWLVLPVALLLALAVRKRSARLAAHSLLIWTVNGLGLLVGWFAAAPRTGREAAC